MSGFFSEQDSHNGSAKSNVKSFNTNDLLDELNQMRLELQHHVDFPQKSPVLFESPFVEPPVSTHEDKKTVSETLHTASPSPAKPHSTGYTQSHQFRIDPPHPEIGEKRDEIKIKRDSTPQLPPKDGIAIPEKWIELQTKEAPKHPVPQQEEPRPHSQDPLAFLAAQETQPPHPDPPSSREVIRSRVPEGYPEFPDVIPMSAKQEYVSLDQTPGFRVDTKHYANGNRVFEVPKAAPISPVQKENDSLFSQIPLSKTLTTVFLTLGLGALACSVLLHLRVLVFNLESWPTHGVHLIIAGVVFCSLGMIFRSYGNQRLSRSDLYPQNQRSNRELVTRFDQGETHQLKKTYHRLLELRNQVDEMIAHVEKKVSLAQDGTGERFL